MDRNAIKYFAYSFLLGGTIGTFGYLGIVVNVIMLILGTFLVLIITYDDNFWELLRDKNGKFRPVITAITFSLSFVGIFIVRQIIAFLKLFFST